MTANNVRMTQPSAYRPDARSWRHRVVPAGIVGSAAFVAGIGLWTVLAWSMGAEESLRLIASSSLVQFNTGASLLILGTGLWAAMRGRQLEVQVLATLALVAPVLTIAEYVGDLDLGIDQLIRQEVPTSSIPFPGRMAPNTAVAILVAALALFLLARGRNAWTTALGSSLASVVASLGLVALLGYAFDFRVAYTWSHFIEMALLTAGALVLMGSGLFLAAFHRDEDSFLQKLPRIAPGVGMGLSALTVLTWGALRSQGIVPALFADILGLLGMCVSGAVAALLAQTTHLKLLTLRLLEANQTVQARSAEVEDLYQNAPCGYHSLDSHGRFTDINDTALGWLGYRRDELVGRVCARDLLSPASQRRFDETFPNFIRSGAVHDLELEFVRKDGTLLPVLLSATAVRDAGGTFIKSRSTMFDMTDRRRAEGAMQLLAAIVDNSNDAIISETLTGTVTSWNRAAERTFGFSAAEMIGQPVTRLLPADGIDEEHLALDRVRTGNTMVLAESRRLRKGGSIAYVRVSMAPIRNSDGAIVGAATITHDVTELRTAQSALLESERQLRAIMDRVAAAIIVHGADGSIQFANPAAASIMGLTHDQMMGRELADPGWCFVREADESAMPIEEFPVSLVMQREAPLVDYVVGVKRAERTPVVWVLVNAIPEFAPDGRIRQVVVSLVDISERRRLERALARQAHTDSLTGLPNRRHFFEQASREVMGARRHDQPLSILAIDIDHFKKINDAHGHATGDLVLEEFAHLLVAALRAGDIPGRIGGEEFAVVLPQTDEDGAVAIAERLRASIDVAVVQSAGRGQPVRFSASIGVASLETCDETIQDVLEHADRALYQAKAAGRNRVVTATRVLAPS